MFVVVDRKIKTVRVSGLTINEACWLGYKFALHCPDLVTAGDRWLIVAFDTIPSHYSRAENYDFNSDWTQAAYEIAKVIRKNPPMAEPRHDCPSCKCKPECCK